MTLKELYDAGTDVLDENGIESPETDAFYLLEHVTGIGKSGYLLRKNEQISLQAESAYMELIETRARHVPYQYITGEAPFMGYMFKVTSDVLIPRFDTEVLCEKAAELTLEGSRVLDMCTGSGCIAVSLKCLRQGAAVTACDISGKALAVAAENAKLNGADIEFIQGDLFENLDHRKFDIIVSNPPYVMNGEYEALSPEVKDHEPRLALTAGDDGMDIYRRLIPEAAEHLDAEGYLMMEIGCSQAEGVKTLMEKSGFEDIKVIKDLAGLDRVVMGRIC